MLVAVCGSCAEKKNYSSSRKEESLSSSFFFFFAASEKRRLDNLFWGILLQKGFLIQIRFRGQFSGEIFINLS